MKVIDPRQANLRLVRNHFNFTLEQVANALKARELVKLSVLETAGCSPREAAELLAEATGAAVVNTIGSRFVLCKKKEKDSKIGIDV